MYFLNRLIHPTFIIRLVNFNIIFALLFINFHIHIIVIIIIMTSQSSFHLLVLFPSPFKAWSYFSYDI